MLKCFFGARPDVSHLLCSVTEVRLAVSIQTVTSPRIETGENPTLSPFINNSADPSPFRLPPDMHSRCPAGAVDQHYKPHATWSPTQPGDHKNTAAISLTCPFLVHFLAWFRILWTGMAENHAWNTYKSTSVQMWPVKPQVWDESRREQIAERFSAHKSSSTDFFLHTAKKNLSYEDI